MFRLHRNENFFIEKEWTQQILLEALKDLDLRIYPPEHGDAVRNVLADFHDIPKTRLFIGNGADAIIDLLTTLFARNSGSLVIQPTFPGYEFCITAKGGKITQYLLNEDFSLDPQPLRQMIDKSIRIMFLASPNNPTGNQFPQQTVKELLESIKIPFVVDEAYADFAPYSVLKWDYENLIVLRSFSKSAAAAGVRLGYAVANEEVIESLRQIQPIFSVNSVAQCYIIKILQNIIYVRKKIEELKTERSHFFNHLQQVDGIRVYPSDATFFLIRILNTQAKDVVEKLKNEGILVSDRSNEPLLKNCIRVAIGTRTMNNAFVYALKRVLRE
ncbi:MAG: pyridoxal phosphate-dependent aminotransferase [Candidatus Heimdallarchaeota archaeon]